MEKTNTVSVLGCGWLGLPLAEKLLKSNFKVKGSVTKSEKLTELRNRGIDAYKVQFNPFFEGDLSFFDAEILIINIPPKARSLGEEFHLSQIQHIIDTIKLKNGIQKMLFVSSTSVYDNIGEELSENQANATHFLMKAEFELKDFCNKSGILFTVLRLGGLMGYDRIPCKYFDSTKGVVNDNPKVNYVHREDVIGAILQVLENNLWDEVFNVVAPLHPTRKEVLENTCFKYGFSMPLFSEKFEQKLFKTVSPKYFIEKSGYEFIFPDPRFFQYQ
jgi:nucleoside-diphosphate-sugar epimerase